MVERIIELTDILKDTNAALEELMQIIVPKVNRINELLSKVDLEYKRYNLNGFIYNITVKNDYECNGNMLDSKSVIIEYYDKYNDRHSTYIDLDYFGKSDDELFEIFKKESISLKQIILQLEKDRYKNLIDKLETEIKIIENLKL